MTARQNRNRRRRIALRARRRAHGGWFLVYWDGFAVRQRRLTRRELNEHLRQIINQGEP